MMRTVILCLLCIALVALWVYSAREDARIKKEGILRRRYYLQLLKKEDDISKANQRRTQFVESLAASASTHGWTHSMYVAQTYHRGCYPDFEPNISMASSIYRAIMLKCEDPSIVSEAQGLLHQCTHSALLDADVSGDPLPTEPGLGVLTRLHAMTKVPPTVYRTKRREPPSIPRAPRVSDPQNSHDHGVTKSLKTILEDLRRDVECNSGAREEIEAVLFSENLDMTDEEKAKALAVLDSLNQDATHSTLGVTEKDALGLVWSKVASLESPEASETLCKQLASGFERGSPVCSTGKIARIVSALDGVTPDTRITPMWAVREELGSLAAKIRTETLHGVSDMQKAAYDRGDGADVEEKMRADFTQQALKIYCEDLGLEKGVVHPIVKSLAAGF